ncbi:MAG: hypothetical protein GF331_08955 [Chitinivibrionales bacterium]|nr:hypothetical protein [Chitinivibrionales bacterium]
MRWRVFLVTVGTVVLFGGCGDDSDSTTGPQGPEPYTESIDPNAPVWSLVGVQGTLQKFNLSVDSVLVERSWPPFDTSLEVIAADAGMLWAGTYQGLVLRLDTAGLSTLGAIEVTPVEHARITHIAARHGQLWVADRVSSGPPRVHRIDKSADTVIATVSVTDADSICFGVDIAPEAAYALCGNPFTLAKIDISSNTVAATLAVGENPDDPSGTRGAFRGTGLLAVVGPTGWVYDQQNRKLNRIDLTAMTIQATFDISDVVTSANAEMVASTAGVFVSVATPGVVYALDASTGAVRNAWQSAANILKLSITADRLLALQADHAMNCITEIDPETMQTVHETGYDIYSSDIDI